MKGAHGRVLTHFLGSLHVQHSIEFRVHAGRKLEHSLAIPVRVDKCKVGQLRVLAGTSKVSVTYLMSIRALQPLSRKPESKSFRCYLSLLLPASPIKGNRGRFMSDLKVSEDLEERNKDV